jgi:hypothetical protein
MLRVPYSVKMRSSRSELLSLFAAAMWQEMDREPAAFLNALRCPRNRGKRNQEQWRRR